MVGLVVSLEGFVSSAGNLEAIVMEVGIEHDMTPVRIADGHLVLLGESQEVALGAAYAFEAKALPEEGLFPVHIVVYPGDQLLTLDDGQTVKLAARVTLSAHSEEVQPGLRG